MRIPSLRRQGHALALGLILLGMACLLGGAFPMIPAAASNASSPQGVEPFAVGERMVYHVDWNPPWFLFFLPPMDAGEATLSLAEGSAYRDKKTLKIVFTARSSGALVKLTGLTVDDRYEFSSDSETFCTYSVSKKKRQGKLMRDIDYVYFPEANKLHLREIDVATQPRQVLRDRDYEGIPPCVKDLFSALYALRRNQLKVGSSAQVLVGEDEVVKEVEVHVEKKERISTPAGNFNTWQVNTISVIGGLFKGGGKFRMWLSADERRMPVRFEAKVYIGKVTGNLKEAKY